jgi:hypothetical protein
MTKLKAICTAAILGLALSVPAYAGDIDSPGCANPLPTTNSTGDMGSPGLANTSEDIMLDILLGVISVL